jgi:hypothetical protein
MLRSTGCAARILILLEEGHVIDAEFGKVIKETGAEVVFNNLQVFLHRKALHPRPGMNLVVSMLRHEWFRPWLESHIAELDRIFVYDASDTFFQADPFREFANSRGLLLHDEGIMLKTWENRMFHGKSWVRECFNDRPPDELDRVLTNMGLCCGSIAAKATTYLKMLHLMMHSHYWSKCFVDQAIFDYFVYNGTFQSAGIPVTLKSSESVLHITFYKWVPVYSAINRTIFDLSADGKTLPAVVHGCKRGLCAENYYRRCGFSSVEKY